MLKHGTLVAGVVLMLGLVSSQSARADKTETFDSAASAAANGWTVTGSGDGGGIAGWIDTNDAGGASAGEAQFDVNRGPTISYLDTNLGMVVNGNTSGGFYITGDLNYLVGNGNTPDLGIPPYVGFSSSPTDFVGIYFRGDFDDLGTELAWGLRFVTTGDDLIINEGGDVSRIIATDVPRTFSLVYDPSDGDFGSITASISGAGDPIVRPLFLEERSVLDEVAYTQAGLLYPGVGLDIDHLMNIRFDDLTYTGVAVTPVALPGDYNNDFVVNAADYTVWRNNLGAGDESSLNGNGNGLGGVDAGDYTYWKDHFGDTPSGAGGLAGSAVPEPASWLLATLAGAAIGSRRRRQR